MNVTLQRSKYHHMHLLKSKLMAAIAVTIPFSGIAHPGHGESEGFTIIHYFSEPVHATLTTVLLAGVIFAAYKLSVKRSSKKA
jgi:hypothetical protein